MHFVTGGAYNGKSKWVIEYYQLRHTPHIWISDYLEGHLIENPFNGESESIVVLDAVELLFKQWLSHLTKDEVRIKWQRLLGVWQEWENEEQNRKIIIIGTDMTKGIVPMSAEDRTWRDITGWAYQDTVQKADRVDVIWYGVNQQLK